MENRTCAWWKEINSEENADVLLKWGVDSTLYCELMVICFVHCAIDSPETT